MISALVGQVHFANGEETPNRGPCVLSNLLVRAGGGCRLAMPE